MFDSARYRVPEELVEAFVAGQRHGTLIAAPPDGHPQVSILPFVKDGDRIELHMVQADPTFRAISANPKVTFLVSDYLSWSPHHWIDPVDAGRATLHFRAVTYECEASISTDPADVAGALARLLARYEPDATYEPIRDGERYGARLRFLATAQLRIVSSQAKFKVGSASPPEDARQRTIAGLRERGLPGDARAADVIESYLTAAARK